MSADDAGRVWNPMSQQYEPEAPTLVEFLLARIAEDEEEARQYQSRQGDVYEAAGWWDCDRVLAECEAKRRIIEWHKAWPVLVEQAPALEQGDGEGYDFARGDLHSMTARVSRRIAWMTDQEYQKRFGSEPPTGPVLRLLALPYADHPDYREDWKP